MPSGRSTRSAPTSGSAAASGRGPCVAVRSGCGPGPGRSGGASRRHHGAGRVPGITMENAAVDAIELTEEDLALISRDFPAPSHKMPLDME